MGALVSVNDFASRSARGMVQDEVLATGRYRFRFCSTAHLPHGWDAGLLFEETRRTLLCSDLFHHEGDVEPVAGPKIVERSRQALRSLQAGPLANYLPYTAQTQTILERLAALEPATITVMHGSSLAGDGATALRDLAKVFRAELGA